MRIAQKNNDLLSGWRISYLNHSEKVQCFLNFIFALVTDRIPTLNILN